MQSNPPHQNNSANSGLFTYAMLAFITMTGLSYINFLPGVMNALADQIGFTEREAGHIMAVNGYGGFAGLFAAIMLVTKVPWQRALTYSLLLLALIDFCSTWTNYNTMLVWRFMAGVVGGFCLGIGFAVISRMANPDRGFGSLLFIQFSIGSLIIYLLPSFEIWLGSYAVFYLMAVLSLLSLIFLFVLPQDLPQQNGQNKHRVRTRFSMDILAPLVVLLLFQSAANGIWAYAGLIGLNIELSHQQVGTYTSMTGLLGLAGAILPIVLGSTTHRRNWLVLGISLSMLATVLMSLTPLTETLYIGAMALLFFAWPAVVAFLLADIAVKDRNGQLSAIAALISALGMATGPLFSSMLVGESDYTDMLLANTGIFVFSLFCLFIGRTKQTDGQISPNTDTEFASASRADN